VNRVQLSDVKIDVPSAGFTALSGEVTFERDGTMHQAFLENEKLRLDVAPERNGLRMLLNARDSRIPFGPPVNFSYVTLAGVAAHQRFTSTEMSARLGGGSLVGTLKANWAGTITATGDFKVRNVRLHEFTPLITPDFSARGLLTASGRYTIQAPDAERLFAAPTIDATFALARGELMNIDLARATQSSGSNSFSGGRTLFDELKGSLQVTGGNYTYRQLQLSSGPLNANGYFAITPDGVLTGRINAEVAARDAVTRTALVVAGTAKEPQLGH
jgi:hypothetical protein